MTLDSAACRLLFSDAIDSESAGLLLRSRLKATARRLGFSEAHRARMVLVAAEMASNLIKHAHGRGMVQIWEQPGGCLDLVSFDYGPGITAHEAAMTDGYSTTGTLGQGLGSMRRLSDAFSLYSRPGPRDPDREWGGTAIWCRFAPPTRDEREGVDIGLFTRSLANDRYNGDHIYVDVTPRRVRLCHLDGLGHGEEASVATADLGHHLAQAGTVDELLHCVDRALQRRGRGAVALACDVNRATREIVIIGVGDVAAHLWTEQGVRRFSFAAGVLGRDHQTPHADHATLPPDGCLVSTTDGIRRGWDHHLLPGLSRHSSSFAAYVLGNALARLTDDQSVGVLRLGPATPPPHPEEL